MLTLAPARQPVIALTVADQSQVAVARRAASDVARHLGFDTGEAEKAALIATEGSTNLLKHGGGGEVLLGVVRRSQDDASMHIVALDKGPGMRNAMECLRDGFSTAGSPGTGLGAIKRLSHRFDVFSQPDRGTVLWSELTSRASQRTSAMEIGVVSRPRQGEDVCGDQWVVQEHERHWRILVADGLGHGSGAADAAFEAVRLCEHHAGESVTGLIQRIHAGLRSTRGAAVAVADLDVAHAVVRYAGVGNISGTVASAEGTRSLVSLNGTAGLEVRKITEFSYPWPDGALLILHSDGLGTHWKLEDYPGLAQRHPMVIAAVLYRDFDRRRDDVTVVVVKARSRSVS